jgi:YHS domain-containing protein
MLSRQPAGRRRYPLRPTSSWLQELPERKFVGRGRQLSVGRKFHMGDRTMTKDPVCGMKVDENHAQYQSQYGGKKYSFCSQDCKTKFEQQPEQYARSAA